MLADIIKSVSNRIWEDDLTHTVTHTGKRADGNNGTDRANCPRYAEGKDLKSLRKRQKE